MPRKRKSQERFVALPYNMLNSNAYIDLSNHAVRIFIELKKRFNGSNNGEIFLSLREAQKICNSGFDTVRKSIHELITNGFIEYKKKGLPRQRKASTFYLTCEKYNNKEAKNSWKDYPNNEANLKPDSYLKSNPDLYLKIK